MDHDTADCTSGDLNDMLVWAGDAKADMGERNPCTAETRRPQDYGHLCEGASSWMTCCRSYAIVYYATHENEDETKMLPVQPQVDVYPALPLHREQQVNIYTVSNDVGDRLVQTI